MSSTQTQHARTSQSSDWSIEDARALKWIGWAVAWTIIAAWSGWISLAVIGNTQRIIKSEERIEIELKQINKQLDSLQTDVQILVRRDAP